MVKEMSYEVVAHVLDSWERLRRVKNYEEVGGAKLFRLLFTKAPQTKVLFGFPIDASPDSDELLSSRRFLMHGAYLIQMLDTALNMIGPDLELLTEIMEDLGEKHVRYGVKPEFYPVMGECLVLVLDGTITLSQSEKDAWYETYSSLSSDMIRSHAKALRRKSSK